MTRVKIEDKELEVDLTEEEVKYINKNLKSNPSSTELGMFDVMWSEHCSYKSSRPKLKLFEDAEKNYDYVLAGPGQDAGVIDIGDGYALAFRIESHNHPSAIEPYHGAATGIGGIIRDILCMGVRPIALLDPLRFGTLKDNPHSQWLFKYVVKGIADYGNCTGIPTIGGEVEFDESFENNCLVNVACIGLGTIEDFKHAPSRAYNPGDYVILMGGSTGRDGIHGVTFASRTLTEQSEEDRPAVQIGDPFTKKLIIEATLEAIKTGYVRGLKDLGGGGLSCALSELTGDGGTGARIDMNKIFIREPGMIPFEIMLSESQERMAFVVNPEGLDEVLSIFQKFEMVHAVIGRIDDSKVLKVYDGDNLVVELPAKALSESPVEEREEKKPSYLDNLIKEKTPELTIPLEEVIYKLTGSENICSKEWIYRQYDHEVGVRSIVKCGDGDAGVLRIIDTNKFIAASVGANSKHCYLDPFNGAKANLVEVCGNVIAQGAKPLAMVNCCNFGNPEKPESYWYFSQSVKGMAEFCKKLRIPVVGGNVSFYNEDEVTKTAIKPTPTIMIVGLIEGREKIITLPFKNAGNDILLIGQTFPELGGSEYHSVIHNIDGGISPKVKDETIEARWKMFRELYENDLVKANHDVNKGGFVITIAEMCFKNELGADLDLSVLDLSQISNDELLFSESAGRFIIETNEDDYDKIMSIANKYKVSVYKIGKVSQNPFIIINGLEKETIDLDVQKMKKLHTSTIPDYMEI
ncbi:MAG: phosphoribosylformylglycinamidine synthase subunit PurL [Candidatus Lokiarchaeota archaeon]|nr:phosphoribosylformylglycinamidine synthase subunit PurL [Candidatus Lokiarchaeota archaeon]MBD3201474.1 phosphoribosylformylglycinamidine synthase subunit PurL [Candidatus Lokiarchaeota archaeon]